MLPSTQVLRSAYTDLTHTSRKVRALQLLRLQVQGVFSLTEVTPVTTRSRWYQVLSDIRTDFSYRLRTFAFSLQRSISVVRYLRQYGLLPIAYCSTSLVHQCFYQQVCDTIDRSPASNKISHSKSALHSLSKWQASQRKDRRR